MIPSLHENTARSPPERMLRVGEHSSRLQGLLNEGSPLLLKAGWRVERTDEGSLLRLTTFTAPLKAISAVSPVHGGLSVQCLSQCLAYRECYANIIILNCIMYYCRESPLSTFLTVFTVSLAKW